MPRLVITPLYSHTQPDTELHIRFSIYRVALLPAVIAARQCRVHRSESQRLEAVCVNTSAGEPVSVEKIPPKHINKYGSTAPQLPLPIPTPPPPKVAKVDKATGTVNQKKPAVASQSTGGEGEGTEMLRGKRAAAEESDVGKVMLGSVVRLNFSSVQAMTSSRYCSAKLK